MASKTLLLLVGLFTAAVLFLSSEVVAREMTETSNNVDKSDKSKGEVNNAKYLGGGNLPPSYGGSDPIGPGGSNLPPSYGGSAPSGPGGSNLPPSYGGSAPIGYGGGSNLPPPYGRGGASCPYGCCGRGDYGCICCAYPNQKPDADYAAVKP